MKIQFKKAIGINVPYGDINLTQNGCTANDKTILSKLRWAEGNLNSQSNYNLTWASSTTDYGYYYIWKNVYVSSGYTGYGAVDPCTRLDESKYGSGWRTPTRNEFTSLSRCSNKQLVKYNGTQGMWFMNSSIGLFCLLQAGETATKVVVLLLPLIPMAQAATTGVVTSTAIQATVFTSAIMTFS